MTVASSPDAWGERRLLVVVAHPDDEVLGCGALLATLRHVHVVHVTDGATQAGHEAAALGFASRSAYAQARHAEALVALSYAGLSADRLISLGVADQQASAALAAIARRLETMVGQADLVLTHAFEGGHSDHDAVAFSVHAACRLHGGSTALYEMPFYYGSESGWVRQRFLPDRASPPSACLTRTLSAADRALKARMIAAYATQRSTLADFGLADERFRSAPDYDFATRPHAGPLLYERHGWNLTWKTWVDRVAAARAELGLPPS